MTDDELRAIALRAGAATPGPWKWEEAAASPDLAAQLGKFARSCIFSPALEAGDQWVIEIWTQHHIPMPDDGYPDDCPEEWTGKSHVLVMPGADAAFIAHARDDVPALLTEIGRLRATLTAIAIRHGRYARESAAGKMATAAKRALGSGGGPCPS